MDEQAKNARVIQLPNGWECLARIVWYDDEDEDSDGDTHTLHFEFYPPKPGGPSFKTSFGKIYAETPSRTKEEVIANTRRVLNMYDGESLLEQFGPQFELLSESEEHEADDAQ
jgi:hypothetical protein